MTGLTTYEYFRFRGLFFLSLNCRPRHLLSWAQIIDDEGAPIVSEWWEVSRGSDVPIMG